MRQHGKVEIENEAPYVCHACGGAGVAGFVEGEPVLLHKQPYCETFGALDQNDDGSAFVEYLRACRNKMQVERGIS